MTQPRRPPTTTLYALIALGALGAGQTMAAATGLTQRQINTWAAAMERVRLAVVDEPGLRGPAEPIGAYLDRLAKALPGEKPAAYRQRINGYLDALANAASVSRSVPAQPKLTDRSPANLQLWQRADTELSRLRRSVGALQMAWRRRQQSGQLIRPERLQEAVAIALSALGDLRDARP